MALSPYPLRDDVIGTGRAEDRGDRSNANAWKVNPQWDRWFNSVHLIVSTLVSDTTSLLALNARVTAVEGQIAVLVALINGYALAFTTAALSAVTGTVTTLLVGTLTVTNTIAALTVTALSSANATVTTLLNLTGGQLKFPAVQVPSIDPNTLDDYEEGAWTPTLLFAGTAVGMTYTTRIADYIKVGKLVTVSCRIDLSAKGASVGAATITGLPFTAANNTVSFNGSALAGGMAALTSPITPRVVANATVVDLFDWGAAGVVGLDDTNFTNTSVVVVTMSYFAAN